MKTIVGKAIIEPIHSILNERMSEVVEMTSDYFNCWRSHCEFLSRDETEIRPNTIYAFVSGRISVVVESAIRLHSDFSLDSGIPFFDRRYMRSDVISENGYNAKSILVNNIFAGYYLTDINTLVLTDWTHDRTAVSIFREVWPQLVRELGLLPLQLESIKKIFPKDILVGCDPEFELILDNEVVEPGENFVTFDRYRSPIGLDGAGDQIELRPSPGKPREVTQNIRKLIEQFSDKYCYHLGTAGNEYPLGGHIHIGVGFQFRPTAELISVLDDFIGKPTINLSGSAREDYKQLGAIRQQPHGFEYRTCPAAVFQNPAITLIVLTLAKNLVKKYLYENTLVYNDVPTLGDYVNMGGLTKQQAKYFLGFCGGFTPTNCLAKSWKLRENKNWHRVDLIFENTWHPRLRNIILEGVSQIRVRKPTKFTMYGLGEKKYGCQGCTVPLPGFRLIQNNKKLECNYPSIGLTYDIRSNDYSYSQSVCNALVNVIKTQIGGK